jgi:hypothetical protein
VNEQELLLDCLRRLNRRNIAYMLTGSMASNAWGIPRTTHDLDFVIQLPPSQIAGFVETFQSEDYFVDEAMIRSAYQPPHQFNVLHIPSALKVDFWILKTDAFECEMFRRKVQDAWLGETVWIATAEDVVLHKLFWNKLTPSDRQLGDVAGVVAVQKGKLDETYLRRWAAELGVATTLEAALSGLMRPKHT